MISKLKELWRITKEAKEQSTSMQRKLRLYWMSMAMSVLAALIVILSFAGVFSDSAQTVSYILNVQQYNTVSTLSEQLNSLNAQAVTLSETISKEISNTLKQKGASLSDLNDNQKLIAEVEDLIFDYLNTTLTAGKCSGVFAVFDATANTDLPYADTSRIGVYLRYSDLNSTASANQHLAYFRGVSDIARKRQVEMHNRWDLEFDTTYLPGYEEIMATEVKRLAGTGIWSERIQLKDTWEDILLLSVPILDWDGKVCGVCGIELSGLYFQLSYPSVEFNYGDMVTILAPMKDGKLFLDQAMLGSSKRLRLEPKGDLEIKEQLYFNIYSGSEDSYIGLHQTLDYTTVNGRKLAAATLISKSNYDSLVARNRLMWISGSLAFLIFTLLMSVFLSRRFVKPIVSSIQSFQSSPEKHQRSGFYEIDELLSSIKTTAGNTQTKNEMPTELSQFFVDFAAKVKTLTPTEHTILQYFIHGFDVNEIAQKTFSSINTVRKHNTNIKRKLCVTSHEELLLCIDLFRRCGKIDEIS